MFRRLWFFLTRWRRIQDLDEEMRLHVELRAAANRRDGLAGAEAARQARLRFGNPLKLREDARDAWGLLELERIAGDLRHAMRRIVQRPGRALVVVLTLALGISATTAMFTLVDAMLLRPAPWNKAGRVVWIAGLKGHSANPGNLSYPDYLIYRNRATTLSGVAAASGTTMSIGSRQPQRVLGGLVSGNYFDVLGIGAQVGRTFAADEDTAPGAHPVAVLSDALWIEQFGAAPSVIGTRVAINGRPFTIIGVAPRGFTGAAFATNPYQLWMPMAMQGQVMPSGVSLLTDANQSWLSVVGRLRAGVTVAEANAEARVIARQWNPAQVPAEQEKSARVLTMRGGLSPWEQESLAPMFGLVSIVPGLVLLVACANAANVLIAHHTARRREFAMRRAIGASRGRLVRQLVAESLVLAILAGLAGFCGSFALSALVMHLGEVPSAVSALLAPDIRALLAATSIAVGAVVIFGVAPALMATRVDVLRILKDEGTASTAARSPARLRRSLVVAQVALSLTLLVTAGLFFQSLVRTLRVDPGFDPQGLVLVSFDLNLQGYTADRRAAFAARFVERASALPEVMSAATADALPLGGEMRDGTIVSESATSSSKASMASVSPRYFETFGLPVVRGREFSPAEVAINAPVAIINETLAVSLWPGVDPLGRHVRIAESKEPWREVVGVARDAKYLFLTESPLGAYYVPQSPQSAGTLVVRTAGNPRTTLAALTNVARDLDPDLPLFGAQTMEERIRRTVSLRRAVVSLLGVLGALTLLLATVGIYGVAAHSVSMRTREVGIRMSLGARAADVLRMIVRENLLLSLVGVAIGLGISAAGSTMLGSYLFGVTAADVATFVGGAFVLCLVSLVASYLPARRAALLDPLLALRRD
ncbi:MAG: ADOP family duplicated permease [Vicinamibacterales bacterium]